MRFVGPEIVKAGGIVLACPIAPHEEARVWATDAVKKTGGGFVLVHISTSFADYEKRGRREGALSAKFLVKPFFLIERVKKTIPKG